MTLQDAFEQGDKVRLPEWTGYWFKDYLSDEVRVYTRTGDVLDTPNYDRYGDRPDWEVVTTSGLGFDFAILALKAGKKLARIGWNGKDMFVYKTVGNTVTKDFIPKFASLPQSVKDHLSNLDKDVIFQDSITMFTAKGEMQPGWLASQSDMLATDWIVIA